MWYVPAFEGEDDLEDEPGGYVTKDSGEKALHSDGVQRDTQSGKTMFPLMFPKGVPLNEQLIVRVAELYTRGAVKYGDRNWEKSVGEDTLEHHTEALWRHFMNFFFEVDDGEDHAAAVVWNINAVEQTRRNQAKAKKKHKKKHKKAKALEPEQGGGGGGEYAATITQYSMDAEWVLAHPPFTIEKLYKWRGECDVTGTAYPQINYLNEVAR